MAHKVYELGKLETDYGCCDVSPNKSKKKRLFFPSFRVEKRLPLVKADVGKEIFATVKLKITKVSAETEKVIGEKEKERFENRFDVLEMSLPNKKKVPGSVGEMKERLHEDN